MRNRSILLFGAFLFCISAQPAQAYSDTSACDHTYASARDLSAASFDYQTSTQRMNLRTWLIASQSSSPQAFWDTNAAGFDMGPGIDLSGRMDMDGNSPEPLADGTPTQYRPIQFVRTCLKGANFSGAKLNGVAFNGADLRGANLAQAELAHADLCAADLRDTQLGAAATLVGAMFNRLTKFPSGWGSTPKEICEKAVEAGMVLDPDTRTGGPSCESIDGFIAKGGYEVFGKYYPSIASVLAKKKSSASASGEFGEGAGKSAASVGAAAAKAAPVPADKSKVDVK